MFEQQTFLHEHNVNTIFISDNIVSQGKTLEMFISRKR